MLVLVVETAKTSQFIGLYLYLSVVICFCMCLYVSVVFRLAQSFVVSTYLFGRHFAISPTTKNIDAICMILYICETVPNNQNHNCLLFVHLSLLFSVSVHLCFSWKRHKCLNTYFRHVSSGLGLIMLGLPETGPPMSRR